MTEDYDKRAFRAAAGQVLCDFLPENYDDPNFVDEESGGDIDAWLEANAWEPFQYWSAKQLWQQIDSVASTLKSFHATEVKHDTEITT